MAENTAKNIDSYKTTTNEATQVAQNESYEGVNVNTFTDNKLILNSNHNNIQNATKIHNVHKTVNDISHINHRPSNLYFNPSRLNEDNQYLINDNTCEYYTNNEFVKSFTTLNNSFFNSKFKYP